MLANTTWCNSYDKGASYPVINDLFKVADVLIPDYSACIADYSIINSPVICFARMIIQITNLHETYIDFNKEMPNCIRYGRKENVSY